LALLHANTLHASLAKSKSRTSDGDTGIRANASLSSLTGAQPTFFYSYITILISYYKNNI